MSVKRNGEWMDPYDSFMEAASAAVVPDSLEKAWFSPILELVSLTLIATAT